MDKLEIIKEPLLKDLGKYEEFMIEALGNENEFVADVLNYIISNRGKGIRPILVLLLGGINSRTGSLGKRNYLAAMLVEMVHTASLVHDDVVDNAKVRHGKPTVNTRWNSRVSVLLGDYILARSFGVGMDSGQFDIMGYITRNMTALAEGELIQSDSSEKLEMTREKYFDIILKKTATLIGTSAAVGAMSSNAGSDEVDRAWQIGINLGMAFQIKDDILDYSPQEQTGKPFCADLRERKITLPLLSIMEKSDEVARRLILCKIESIDADPEQINHIYDLVVKGGGIEAATEVMHQYLDRARHLISAYPDSAYKNSLSQLCDYVGTRDK